MWTLEGDYFDGRDSSRVAVRLQLTPKGELQLTELPSGRLSRYHLQQLEISSRLANSPRYLNLPGGGCIETLDNDAVDAWLQQCRPGLFQGLLHRLESHLRFVLLSLVSVLLVVWLSAQYGVPAAARVIAQQLPAELLDSASEQTLALLDKQWLEPTKITPKRQRQLRRHFASLVDQYPELGLKIGFRDAEGLGANAFALPNGQIIFTDQIVAMAKHDDELLAILAHEAGHVKHRHSQRRLVQNSLFLFMLALITGDMSGTSELVLGLPLLLVELAYSREYETESDQFALAYLKANQIPPQRFVDLMLRLEFVHGGGLKHQSSEQPDQTLEWQRYLLTHPLTHERIQAFQ